MVIDVSDNTDNCTCENTISSGSSDSSIEINENNNLDTQAIPINKNDNNNIYMVDFVPEGDVKNIKHVRDILNKSNKSIFRMDPTASFHLNKSTFVIGDYIEGVLNFKKKQICLKVVVSLEMLETVDSSFYKKDSSYGETDVSEPSVICSQEYNVCCLNNLFISLPIPETAQPTFSTNIISISWRLRFVFSILSLSGDNTFESLFEPIVESSDLQKYPIFTDINSVFGVFSQSNKNQSSNSSHQNKEFNTYHITSSPPIDSLECFVPITIIGIVATSTSFTSVDATLD